MVVVCGTGTDVGKTWVAASLARTLDGQGLRVAARKPAQSFERPAAGSSPGGSPQAGSSVGVTGTDADVLSEATGEDPHQVCPSNRWYPVALAPPMATEALGLPAFAIADLLGEVVWPDPPADVGLVETAGGVRSPQAADGDAVDLVVHLVPDRVVLVADATLGTIHSVRASVDALARGAVPVVVHLNRFDPRDDVHARNRAWLAERDALVVTTTVEDLAARLVDPGRGSLER